MVVHITTAEGAAGILKVGLIRTMGSGGGRAATMFSPVSQTDRRAVGGMLHEGDGLDHEIHVDVAAFHLRGEEIWCSMSGSLSIMDDVHYTEITYLVQLFAGQKVTVHDRNLQKAFPTNATDIRADAWEEAQDTGIPDCWNVEQLRAAPWVGSYFRCPECVMRQRAGVTKCFTPDCAMIYDDIVRHGDLDTKKHDRPAGAVLVAQEDVLSSQRRQRSTGPGGRERGTRRSRRSAR